MDVSNCFVTSISPTNIVECFELITGCGIGGFFSLYNAVVRDAQKNGSLIIEYSIKITFLKG